MDLALAATHAAPPCPTTDVTKSKDSTDTVDTDAASADAEQAAALTPDDVRRLYVVSTAAFDISGGGLAALAQFVAGTARELGTLCPCQTSNRLRSSQNLCYYL